MFIGIMVKAQYLTKFLMATIYIGIDFQFIFQ